MSSSKMDCHRPKPYCHPNMNYSQASKIHVRLHNGQARPSNAHEVYIHVDLV